MKEKITVFLFLVVLGSLCIGMLVLPKREYSYLENRYLETAPVLSASALGSGEYMKKIEKFLSDQLLLKDFLVRNKVFIERLQGRIHINGVSYEEERYLEDYKYNHEQTMKRVETLNELQKISPQKTKWYVLPAPINSFIYEDEMPFFFFGNDQDKLYKNIKKALALEIELVDVRDHLKEHKNEDIYFQTDHHWTMKGAYYAYEVFAKSLGLEMEKLADYEKITLNEEFLGSLYSKAPSFLPAQDTIEAYEKPKIDYEINQDNKEKTINSYLQLGALEKKDKYDVFFGGNHGKVSLKRTNVEKEKQQKILILKDSYANCFVPFLMNSFSEITMIDQRYFVGDLEAMITQESYDVILVLEKF